MFHCVPAAPNLPHFSLFQKFIFSLLAICQSWEKTIVTDSFAKQVQKERNDGICSFGREQIYFHFQNKGKYEGMVVLLLRKLFAFDQFIRICLR